MRAVALDVLEVLVAVAGLVLIAWGAWQMYAPAGSIVAGVGLLVTAYLVSAAKGGQ